MQKRQASTELLHNYYVSPYVTGIIYIIISDCFCLCMLRGKTEEGRFPSFGVEQFPLQLMTKCPQIGPSNKILYQERMGTQQQ
jgi:hypothetical protein